MIPSQLVSRAMRGTLLSFHADSTLFWENSVKTKDFLFSREKKLSLKAEVKL